MEKQGMERRKRILRTGLLILVLLPGSLLFSQQPETPKEESSDLVLRIETSPANPSVNSPWSISILVNHPNPQEVNVKPPEFPPFLSLERIRTEGRSVPGGAVSDTGSGSGEDRLTRVEFLFTPLREGNVTLGPFELSVPGRQALSDEISVYFREEAGSHQRYNPRFRWLSPSPVSTGKQGELILELSNWDPLKKAPVGIFQGRAPRNAILDEKLPAEAGEGLYRYTISIIPLEESSVILEPFLFEADIYSLGIPGITVTVPEARRPMSPVPGLAPEEETGSFSADEAPQNEIPFPAGGEKVFFLLEREYKRVSAGVRDLWEQGRRAEALAEIRRNERDSLVGPFLRPLRVEMEQALDLSFAEDESWRPLRLPHSAWLLLGLLVFAMILLVFRPLMGIRGNSPLKSVPSNSFPKSFSWNGEGKVPNKEKSVTSLRRGGFRNVIIIILSIGLALILLEVGLGNLLLGRLSSAEKTAILERTQAFRVPDLKGAVNTRFGEGQPVIVGTYHQDWCYVETTDGRSGWVKREAVISY